MLLGIGWVVNYLFQGAASLRRIEEILTRAPTIPSPSVAQRPAEVRGEIRFDDVSFSYDGSPVLERFSLLVSEQALSFVMSQICFAGAATVELMRKGNALLFEDLMGEADNAKEGADHE